jgi:arylsulfatase A-like enzyme
MQYRLFGPIAEIPKLDRWQYFTNAEREDPAFQDYRENRERLYDCALRYVDAQIARVFDFLKMQGLFDSSLVIVTADHGEEFWDHGEMEQRLFLDPRGVFGIGHGHSLFQEVITVPLICTGFGVAPGRYNHNVSLVDIVPTILNICGISYTDLFDGQDLFGRSDGRLLTVTGICYGYEKIAIIENNWKLIHSEGDKVSLLFDLDKDPKEQHDLTQVHPDIVEQLKAALPTEVAKGEALKVTRDVEDQLRHLGYM